MKRDIIKNKEMKSNFEDELDYNDRKLVDKLNRMYCDFDDVKSLLQNNHKQHGVLMILLDVLKHYNIRVRFEEKFNNDKKKWEIVSLTHELRSNKLNFDVYNLDTYMRTKENE